MQEELSKDREDFPEDLAKQIPMGDVLWCGFRILIDIENESQVINSSFEYLSNFCFMLLSIMGECDK